MRGDLYSPDCAARRAAMRALDRVFNEENHCRRIALIHAVGRGLR